MQLFVGMGLIAAGLAADGAGPDSTRSRHDAIGVHWRFERVQGGGWGAAGRALPSASEVPAAGARGGDRPAAWRRPRLFGGARWRLDTFFSEPADEDRTVISVAPTVWWNDASDLTVGIRLRTNDRGRYNRWTVWLHRGVWDAVSSLDGTQAATLGESVDFFVRFENPAWLQKPGARQSVEAWAREGTTGARIAVGQEAQPSFATANRQDTELHVQWVATRETRFLDPRLWENAGTVEAGAGREWDMPEGFGHLNVRLDLGAGLVYTRDRGFGATGTYRSEVFGRATGSAWMRKPVLGFGVAVRVFAGVYLGDAPPVLQRRIPVNGADPYQTLHNPLVRTSGAPLVHPDLFYHSPGNLNLRGYRPDLGGRWGTSANVEIERDVIRRDRGVFRSLAVVGFWDGGVVDTVAVVSTLGRGFRLLVDGGGGVRAWFRLGDVTFPVRIEFPVYVSAPLSAHNSRGGNNPWEFRWLVSVQPIF